jgi:hypothetical protein
MNAIPDQDDFEIDTILSRQETHELKCDDHRQIISQRLQDIANRKRDDREFDARCEAEIQRIRTLKADRKSRSAEETSFDRIDIAMSKAALAAGE